MYVLIDNILHHLTVDKSLRIVLPTADWLVVFEEVHKGKLQDT